MDPKALQAATAEQEQPQNLALNGLIDEQAEHDASLVNEVEQTAEQKKADAAANELMLKGSETFIAGLLDAGENGLQTQLPYVVFPADKKAAVAKTGAVVMLKYQAAPPPWMAEHMPEILLVGALASLGFGVYAQVRAHEAEEAAKEREHQRTLELMRHPQQQQ